MYHGIVSHYESCLEKHGDSHLGVDWPDAADARTRYQVMLDLLRPSDTQVRLLDFGCGASHLLDYLGERRVENVVYSGLDLSQKFVDVARSKHPGVECFCADFLERGDELPRFDYVVMNGVFTEKLDLSYDEMWSYFTRLVAAVFEKVDVGLAFNVMSKHVDWERDDLFHVPYDELAAFLAREVSRQFLFRSDYGLYEYTTYVYRSPAETRSGA